MARGTRIEGLPELEKRLRRMQDHLQGEVLSEATKVGAETLLEFQQALAPRKTGFGARELAIQEDDKLSPTRSNWHVGPSKRGYYLMFHEIGTVHMAPSPFMRPALSHARKHIVEDVREALRRSVLKEVG